MALRIEDYAVIGDTHTAALVGRDGSIDWLCLPRFDSPASFSKLLGEDDHGFWRVAPLRQPGATRAGQESPEGVPLSTHRAYRGDSLVLETEWAVDGGTVRLIDFMPCRESNPEIVRIVQGVSGSVEMEMTLVLRPGYGTTVPWVRSQDGLVTAIAGPDGFALFSPVETHGEDMRTVARFTVREGQTVQFLLAWFESYNTPPRPVDPRFALDDTTAWWHEWASMGCLADGLYSDAVVRSLITLKALTYAPTGGIVAAVTTSLPETLGGERNWDYRYCWLRDATLTLTALMTAGYHDEAAAWRDWLLRAVAGDPSKLQIMYGVGGERNLTEAELDWLPGYEGSRPVRIGNAASGQYQLDVYGEVMGALHESRRVGLETSGPAWELEKVLLDFLETGWKEPDDGIWEVRGPRRHFTHSKVMAWYAIDSAVRDMEDYGPDEGELARFKALRRAIHAEVCEKGYDRERKTFTQYYGSRELDASVLMAALVGFLPPTDERIVGTVEAIEKELLVDGFVQRYDSSNSEHVDGLSGREGAFLACSFWLADNYALIGRKDDATEMFERLLSLRNDVGLLAEEYDPVAKRLVGNFPQAFSHISLVNTAVNLSPHLEGAGMSHSDRLSGMRPPHHRQARIRRPHYGKTSRRERI
ncbi:MAG TPA: glycoside hydrolase family 15 protein [Acidimicrobiales bacterium]|nr:glycoside hydrolase family 15 protein [Acidimicrobiales bacterium]